MKKIFSNSATESVIKSCDFLSMVLAFAGAAGCLWNAFRVYTELPGMEFMALAWLLYATGCIVGYLLIRTFLAMCDYLRVISIHLGADFEAQKEGPKKEKIESSVDEDLTPDEMENPELYKKK
jgi:hypothetical protein